MSAVENTVFISYRRETSSFIARAMFMDLRDHGYDVFMDVESINAGEFEGIILRQIAARAHFLMILAPGTLERCQHPGDWVRRELEEAIRLQRNIIPILVNDFRFKDEEKYLTGTLTALARFNGLTLPHEYFDAGMDKLRNRFLTLPVQVEVADTPQPDQPVVQQKIAEVTRQPRPDEAALSAEQWLNRGYEKHKKKQDFAGAIADYTEAIRLKPQYAKAFTNRGLSKALLGDYQGAIVDWNEAIRLNPQYSDAYYNLGVAKTDLGDYQGAAADFTEAIRLNPHSADTYYNRGNARYSLQDNQGAIADFTEAIRLNPQHANACYNRGNARYSLQDYQGAIADFTEAIRLSQEPDAYNNRGNARYNLQDYQGAIADFAEAIRLNPQFADAYNNRGYAWENLGDYEKALADYEAALRIKPDYELARKNRDDLLKKMKR